MNITVDECLKEKGSLERECLDIVDSAMRKQWYKDEPTTQTETQNSNLTFEKADEPQTDELEEPNYYDPALWE